MRYRLLARLFIFTITYLSASLFAYALDFREGEWELVVSQSVKGMPTGLAKTQWRECLSKANPIPTLYLQARSCDVLEQHAVYHTLHYKMSCYTDHGTLTNEGKIHFGDFKVNGNSKSNVGEVAGENMVVRYKFAGRRIGDCH
jgi:hypothetical protein